MNKIISTVLDLLFPKSISCYLCRFRVPEEGYICGACFDSLPRVSGPVCAKCGRMGDFWSEDEVCERCAAASFSFDKARAVFLYEGDAARAIHAIKFGGAPFLCDDLARAMLPLADNADILVPVPLYPKRQKARGYNQSEKLCDALVALSQTSGNRYIAKVNALERSINTKPQSRLSAKKRAAQMKQDVFAPSGEAGLIKGRRVMLIDDVFTTGATIDACARQLVQAGAASVEAVTVCVA